MRDADDLDGADLDDDDPIVTVDVRDLPIRFSALKQIDRSAAHYRHAALNRGESNPAQRMGTFTHAATFGTPRLAVCSFRRGTKDHKAFVADNPGALICNPREYRIAMAMAASLRSDPVVAPVLFGADMAYEVEIEWEIKMAGKVRTCRGRIDALGDDHVIDLKALRDASPGQCQRVIRWSDYHTQAVWYADGCEKAGIGTRRPSICVVENSAPYPCVWYPLSARAIEYGRARYLGWLEKLAVAIECDAWHGYAQGPVEFDVPDDEPFSLKLDGGEFDLTD